jgi:hypothetical protein
VPRNLVVTTGKLADSYKIIEVVKTLRFDALPFKQQILLVFYIFSMDPVKFAHSFQMREGGSFLKTSAVQI